MEYIFRYESNFEDLLIFNKLCTKVSHRWWVIPLRAIYFIFGFLAIIYGLVCLRLGHYFWAIVELACGVILVRSAIFYYRIVARRSQKTRMKGIGESVITLNEEGMRDKDNTKESIYSYEAFVECYHTQQRYFLFLDKHHAIILPERAIVQGEPNAFAPWLTEKLGKEIKEFH